VKLLATFPPKYFLPRVNMTEPEELDEDLFADL
jgi:hypothetical protein